MATRPRRRVRMAILLPALALPALALAGWWVAGSAFMRTHPADLGPTPPGAREVDIATSGPTLRGWAFDVPRGACVLLLHGIGANRAQMAGRAKVLRAAGYGALLLDQRGHGESEGDIVTFGGREAEDAAAGVAWLRANGCARVGVDGFSMGGAAALIAGESLNADAVVVEGVYATLDEAADVRLAWVLGPLAPLAREILAVQLPLRAGIWKSQIRPVDGAARVGAPALVMAGGADHRAPVEAARRIADALGDAPVVVFPGVGHKDFQAIDPGRWESAAVGHFDRYLRAGR